ncbi:hypothetical protein INS49_012693 [Diaporthe citri]|uniref:uncharacterized protein n=1 Tax=Diaporthe citri TaxID=83186 RepID=UPI001C7E2B0A|nr:uncharacterized protein INS49_012693 [Diaporthe citri]KAG6359173.1 hypothetical protein INS49_012693 [Diaporthe citri]
MALRRRRIAEFRLLEGDDTGQTDTCSLEDDEIYLEYPKEDSLSLIGRDSQWAEAAIEPSADRKCAFYVYKWGTNFTDGDDFVDVWSHGRLLVSVRRLEYGDGQIAIGTTDIKNILAAIDKKESFRGESNAVKRLPIFSGLMTFIGPNECDVDLEWIVWLDEVHDQSRTGTSGGDMDEIVVQES